MKNKGYIRVFDPYWELKLFEVKTTKKEFPRVNETKLGDIDDLRLISSQFKAMKVWNNPKILFLILVNFKLRFRQAIQ